MKTLIKILYFKNIYALFVNISIILLLLYISFLISIWRLRKQIKQIRKFYQLN